MKITITSGRDEPAARPGLWLLLLALLAAPSFAADQALVFTKASGYEHGIVARKGKPLSFAEQRLKTMLEARGLAVECTKDMDPVKGKAYRDLPQHPVAWVRNFGRGRVFYNSLGQELPVWDSELFQVTMQAGLDWVLGKTQADPTPNLLQVMPKVNVRGN
jgi:hypothetical protein